MIKSVTVTNYRNESLTLELSNPFDIGINVRSIEGIGPPKGNVNYTEIASGDGGVYNSARAGTRNITMELGLMQTPSVEENRHKVYKYFVLNKEVTLTFETDKRICQIVGYVEECEPDIFSDDETVSISVLCPNPYFYSIDAGLGLVDFSSVVNEFEFPFENSPDNSYEINALSDISIRSVARSTTSVNLSDELRTGIVDSDYYFITSYGTYSVAAINISDAESVKIEAQHDRVNYTTNLYLFTAPIGSRTGESSLTYYQTIQEKWSGDSRTIQPGDYSFSGKNLFLVFEVETSLSNAKTLNIQITMDDGSGGENPGPDPGGGGDIPSFDFPDLPEDHPLYPTEIDTSDTSNQYIEFASLVYRQEENVPYDGDIPTGFTIRLHAIGEVRNITIYNMDTRERLAINTERVKEITGTAFNAGDDIIISTERGNKSIIYVHDGISYNILNALERNTDWFILSKGDNVFAYICEYGTEDLLFTIEFPTLYWGI